MSHPAIRAAVPRGGAEPIDLAHLRAQTCGDAALEADLLDLFSRQARTILRDLTATAAPRRDADLLHTLCGSARVVGAWEVATGAEQLERIRRRDAAEDRAAAPQVLMEALGGSVARACRAIEALRGGAAHPGGTDPTRR